MPYKNNPSKISNKELNDFIPIAKLKCAGCGAVVEVAYNGLCERCLKQKALKLVDVQ